MNLTRTTQGKRTMLFEDDLHVGTILEHAKPKRRESGEYVWYSACTGGHASSSAEAEAAIRTELER